ncbi:hypothetical protein [Glaciecola sp. SC05]|uniref:hypothetical protein n=1 Tax=Glaciecola sp. SC05 TaxID=1987355 RepID=UPI003528A2E9
MNSEFFIGTVISIFGIIFAYFKIIIDSRNKARDNLLKDIEILGKLDKGEFYDRALFCVQKNANILYPDNSVKHLLLGISGFTIYISTGFLSIYFLIKGDDWWVVSAIFCSLSLLIIKRSTHIDFFKSKEKLKLKKAHDMSIVNNESTPKV